MDHEDDRIVDSGGISRRKMLRRIGAGAAIAWTAPVLTSMRAPAFAQGSIGCPGGGLPCQAPGDPCTGQVLCGNQGLFLQPERDQRPPQRELLLHRADGLLEPGLPEQLRLPGRPGLPSHLLRQPQVLRGVQRGHRAWGRWDVEVRSTIAPGK
jgi:hypothetical protein